MTSPDRLDDSGLPAARDRHITLSYNAPAQTLIAVSTRAPSREKRVFVRHISNDHYREVVVPLELGFIDDMAPCAGRPVLFISVWQWRAPSRAAADFARLGRVTLPAGVPEPLPPPTLADTPAWNGPAIPIAVWVEQILGVDPDGREVSIVAAIVIPTGETLYSEHTERWVATFDVSDGSVKPISRLLAVGA